MIKKTKEREKAIKLRKQGLSYREILAIIPVSKSSLSLWLRSIGLSKRQKQRLTEKKMASMRRAWISCKRKRILTTEKIQKKAIKDIGKITRRELQLIGIALYWAEGAKQKEQNVSQGVKLGNSDPIMIKIFLKWLMVVCKIPKKDICFRIFLHRTAEHKIVNVQKYWSDIAGFPITKFQKVTWKKHNIKTTRKNIQDNYYGLLEVGVFKSTNLNRQILGWVKGICRY